MTDSEINIDSSEKLTNIRSVDNSLFENPIAGKWLNTKEAADYLRISENALRIKVCRGQIKSSRFGRRLRFKKWDLDNALSVRKVYV